MTKELWLVHTKCGVGSEQLREIALNGFRYAFIPWDERQALLRSVLNGFPMPSLGVHAGMVILSSRFKVQGSKLVHA